MHRSKRESILATYELTPQAESIERCADLLLNEMTSGIQYYSAREGAVMDRVRDHVPFVDDSVLGEVVSIRKKDDAAYMVTFSMPATNFSAGLGGITNLWPVVAGEVFNFHFIRRARLVDLDLPDSLESRYLGPRFGIAGIRKMVGVGGSPLFGAIIKPNLGLDPKGAAELAGNLAEAGFDFIKDDEISVSPDLCPLRERVEKVDEALDAVSQKTGRKMLFMANVTCDFATLGKAASTAVSAGAGGLMIDPFCTGISAIDFLRREFDKPLYLHRVGYGLFCSGPDYSISYELFSKLFRLLGADFSHVGGIWGGSWDAKAKTSRYLSVLRHATAGHERLRETWPVVSGLSIENMGEYHDFYGDDTLFLDHIDIYRGVERARTKLQALKNCLICAPAGGTP